MWRPGGLGCRISAGGEGRCSASSSSDFFGTLGWSGRDGGPERERFGRRGMDAESRKIDFQRPRAIRACHEVRGGRDAIKESTYTFSTDKPSVVVEFTARFDGNDYPISNSMLNTVSLKRVDDQTVERTGKIQGQVVETETRTVSDGGKVLTVTTKGTRDGAEYSSVQVYDRQPLYTRYQRAFRQFPLRWLFRSLRGPRPTAFLRPPLSIWRG